MSTASVAPLQQRLRDIERDSLDYWTFSGRDGRTGAHNLLHYPAMMVPQVQGTVLDLLLDANPDAHLVSDPFMGSGTTLVEAMHRGLAFVGIDINPLAGLLSMVKAFPLDIPRLLEASGLLLDRIAEDSGGADRAPFPNERKWFEPAVSLHLSRIARAIAEEGDWQVRRVFWVAIARCARLACNSRSSTYKLHQRTAEEIAHRDHGGATTMFADALQAIVLQLAEHQSILSASGLLQDGRYAEPIDVIVDDAARTLARRDEDKYDIVMTSPPYGDNTTTVPYGQYSYLPLQFIPLDDIAPGLDRTLLGNTHALDTASLGGSLTGALDRGAAKCRRYGSYDAGLRLLSGNANGSKRFAAFAADLEECVGLLAARTAAEGFHAWTIGDRFIGGQKVPMCDLLAEMLEFYGIEPLHSASRRILAKKMANRNSMSRTMTSERILLGMKA